MTKESNVTAKPVARGNNTVGTITGWQDLDTGLVYEADGTVVDRPIENPETVVSTEQIGAFRRIVHADGSVDVNQTLPLN